MGHKDILKKLYKDGTAISANDIKMPPAVATASPSLNWAIGGGIVPGRFYCFEGPKSGGKTMMAASCVGQMLRADKEGVVFWFDSEMSFTPHWSQVFIDEEDRDRLVVVPKNQPEHIFDFFYNDVVGMIENDGLKVLAVVLDSLQSVIPPKELARSKSTDAQWAALAGYLPGALRLVLEPSRRHEVPWIIISQVRQNLDPSAAYTGEKWIVGGGEAFKHSIDVDVQFTVVAGKDSKILNADIKNANDTSVQTGHTVRAAVKKNRLAPPNRVAEFKLDYNKGIVRIEEEIAQLGINNGIITKEGNSYFFNGQRLAVGMEKTIDVISGSQAIQQEIISKILEKKE